jgi:hypothetical protein
MTEENGTAAVAVAVAELVRKGSRDAGGDI